MDHDIILIFETTHDQSPSFLWVIVLYNLYRLANDLTNNLAPLDLPAKNLHS